MKPDVTYILNKTKQLLSIKVERKRIGSFSVRLVIHILEMMANKPDSPVTFTNKQLSKSSLDDVCSLISIEDCGINFIQDHALTTGKLSAYRFLCDDFKCTVFFPRTFIKKGNLELDDLIKQTWDYYFKKIGSDENIYKKRVTLTRSRDGRYAFLKNTFLQNPDLTLEDARLVIDGATSSLFHMGFDEKTGKRQKKYCDVKNIFTNRHRIEAMILKSTDEHYSVQLAKIQDLACKKNFIGELKTALESNHPPLIVDEWLEM